MTGRDMQQKYADAVRLLVETANAEAKRLSAKPALEAGDARAVADLAQALSTLGRATNASQSPLWLALRDERP